MAFLLCPMTNPVPSPKNPAESTSAELSADIEQLRSYVRDGGRNGRSLDETMEKCRELKLETGIIVALIRRDLLMFDTIEGVQGIRIICKKLLSK